MGFCPPKHCQLSDPKKVSPDAFGDLECVSGLVEFFDKIALYVPEVVIKMVNTFPRSTSQNGGAHLVRGPWAPRTKASFKSQVILRLRLSAETLWVGFPSQLKGQGELYQGPCGVPLFECK